MNKPIAFHIILLICFFQSSIGQVQKVPDHLLSGHGESTGTKSDAISTPLLKEVYHIAHGDKWATSVKSTFSRVHADEALRQIKADKLDAKIKSMQSNEESSPDSRAVVPAIGVNFEANWTLEGTPPDNSLAISNGGYIVTANNDGVEYYTSSGTFLYFDYWTDFFNDNTLTASIFDPKVIYDSGADRFVLTVLHGSNANNSKVLICFSKTNNPQNGWWVYSLTGNPLNNNCWFDYPALGVSTNEIYISGNLFSGNSFNQAVLYQIQKANGYAGQNLQWQYWANLNASPYKAFTLYPASYGHQGNYGPGVYLVSNSSTGDNRIRFWDLTDDMNGTPEILSYTINTQAYSPAADAFQLGTGDHLDNGDCRVQNAFYLDGIVHFVFHADIGDGWNGINYNRINVTSRTIQSSTFGLQGSYDYAYPAVVPFSTSLTDRSVMIGFLRASEETYPQVRVVNCDHNMTWSPSTLVKAGETYVDFSSGDERWGDYTGIARRHNSTGGRIWMAGAYGANITSQNTSNTYKTRVAEVFAGELVQVNDVESPSNFIVYPNPSYDLMNIVFNVVEREPITISIFDVEGKQIKILYEDTPKMGENKLTFNRFALSAGTYFLSIQAHDKILKNEKIIILH